MKRTFRLLFLIISVLTGAHLFNEFFESTIGFSFLIIVSIFVVSSILAMTIPSELKIKYIHKYLTSFMIWLIALGITIGAVFLCFKFKNSSAIIYAVEFYSEEGLDMNFMQNGTFRAQNDKLLDNSVSYGKYSIKDSTIILEDEVYWGMSKFNDTLFVTEKGINFTLETPWRNVNEETMYFKRR